MIDDAWLSLVERCVRDAEVASSNLVASIRILGSTYNEAWLSLVERRVRDAEVAGSNPVASISGSLMTSFFHALSRMFINL